MCYHNCIKYECPNCGEEPIPDRRTDVLCPPHSPCSMLNARLLPRHISFRPGPLCNQCRRDQVRQRQQANVRSANQNGRRPWFANQQQPNRYRPQPVREMHQNTTHRPFDRRPGAFSGQNADRQGQQWAWCSYSPQIEDSDDAYENYHYHTPKPREFLPRPPTPAHRQYQESTNRRPSPLEPPYGYQDQYRGPPIRSPVTHEPSYGYPRCGLYHHDDSPGAFSGDDGFEEEENGHDYWIHDVGPMSFE